jgi:two-component sensor histidine kinase
MASFSTFRSRLIFLFALATFPAVALALTLSWHVYVNAKAASEESWRRTALAAYGQESAVIRNAVGIMQMFVAVSGKRDDSDCTEQLSAIQSAQTDYRAIAVIGPSGVVCAGGEASVFEQFPLADLTAPLANKQAQARDPSLVVNGAAEAPVVVVAPLKKGRDNLLAIAVDRQALSRAISDIIPDEGGTVALVDANYAVLAASGQEGNKERWLPEQPLNLQLGVVTLRADSRDGRSFAYRVEPIAGGPLAVIAGFPIIRFGPPERQLAIGLIFPFVLFVIVLAVAWLAIDRLFLHWVRRLDGTARRLAFGDFSVRAELPADAPLELRQYANAFDQMTDVLASRTRELATVAQQRSQLLRELHHRVKNNFQVIASFLNLMKRARVGETREALAFAESRVHAMAAAYKLALAQGDIRLVAVGALVQDVVNYVQHAADMVRRNVQVTADEPGAYLSLDRAIPLALVLVETLWPLLISAAGSGPPLSVVVARNGTRLSLVIAGSGQTALIPEQRFQRAFLQQIDAIAVEEAPAGSVLAVTLPLDQA